MSTRFCYPLAGAGCEVRVGAQPDLDTSITWDAWQTGITSMESLWPAWPVPTGIYISFAIRSVGVGDYWEFSGFKLFGSGNGQDVDE